MSKTEELTLTDRYPHKVYSSFDRKVRTLVFNPHGEPVTVKVTGPNGERNTYIIGKGSIITSFGPTIVKATKVPTLLRITTHS